MSKKWLLSLSFLLIVFVMAACSDNGDDSAEDKKEESETQEQASPEDGTEAKMPEPDLEDIPDVVAEVNGKEISKEEFAATYEGQFQQAAMQAQMSGQEVDQDQLKEQITDGLIGQELVIQEAENSGFDASEDAVNETLDSLVEQNGLESQDDFFAALEKQGMPKEDVMSQVETQVKVNKLIASETGDVDPTKEELQKIYDEYTAQLEQVGEKDGEEQEIPSFDEMKPKLIEQVKSEKESETYQTLVKELQEDADITKNL
ncbi:SurA N-terminal domain-containing protein [Virgibacillus sp. FSP13]